MMRRPRALLPGGSVLVVFCAMRFRYVCGLVAAACLSCACSSKSTGKTSTKDAGIADSALPEAGVDAQADAPQDAPPPDAPQPDAPTDAPPPDAPPPDAALPAYAQEVLGDNPILYLRFDDNVGSGVDLTNSGSLSGVNCVIQTADAGTVSVTGKVGNAVKIGSTEINCGDVAEFTLKSPFTLEGWFQKTSGATGAQRLFYRLGPSANGSQGYVLNSSGFGVAMYRYLDNVPSSVVAKPPLLNGTWIYVAATYDGAQICVYLDGANPDCASSAESIPPVATTLRLGGSGGSNFTGNIDEVAIYSKALSKARIDAHYAAGK